MIYKFSKPSQDILKEHVKYKHESSSKLYQQLSTSKHLNNTQKRKKCVLCGSEDITKNNFFSHRGIKFFCCLNCKHIQTLNMLPDNYPFSFLGKGFEKIYEVQDIDAYMSRVSRIYEPKLKWIQNSLQKALSLTETQIKNFRWLEIGCGAGFFLKALKKAHIKKIYGLDTNIDLIKESNKICGEDYAKLSETLSKDIEIIRPNIVIAFFVLEHLEEEERSHFWKCLKKLPTDTIFVFSVPCLGFSTILENSFDNFAARNLDNVVHTQLFTDKSIEFMLSAIGYEKISEWLFGQDMQDLIGILGLRSQKLIECGAISTNTVMSIVDQLQKTLDNNRLCDARHIICVKR